jgi:hypothetical protein
LIVVCAPAIAVTAGVFIATTAARGGRTAAAAAMPAAITLPTRCLPLPLPPRCRGATAAGKLPLPPPPPRCCRTSRRGAATNDAALLPRCTTPPLVQLVRRRRRRNNNWLPPTPPLPAPRRSPLPPPAGGIAPSRQRWRRRRLRAVVPAAAVCPLSALRVTNFGRGFALHTPPQTFESGLRQGGRRGVEVAWHYCLPPMPSWSQRSE